MTKVKTINISPELKREIATASAALFEDESTFIRAAVVERLAKLGRLQISKPHQPAAA